MTLAALLPVARFRHSIRPIAAPISNANGARRNQIASGNMNSQPHMDALALVVRQMSKPSSANGPDASPTARTTLRTRLTIDSAFTSAA
jgi:hypothetical protein